MKDTNLNGIFDGVCTVEGPRNLYVVTPFAFENPEGASRAVQAFQEAKAAGERVSLRYWQFGYEGREPTYEDFTPTWSEPRC